MCIRNLRQFSIKLYSNIFLEICGGQTVISVLDDKKVLILKFVISTNFDFRKYFLILKQVKLSLFTRYNRYDFKWAICLEIWISYSFLLEKRNLKKDVGISMGSHNGTVCHVSRFPYLFWCQMIALIAKLTRLKYSLPLACPKGDI